MIAWCTRLLLVLQMLLALAIGHAIGTRWPDLPLMLCMLAGLTVVLGIRALITANNFRLAAQFTSAPPASLASPTSRLGTRALLRQYRRELAATLLCSSWYMPFRRLGDTPVAFQGGPAVLLIHGYGCNSGYWRPLHRRLVHARISFHAVDLEPVFGDIDDYLGQVGTAIDALRAATGHSQVILVGHSMGGLVALAWLRRHGTQRIAGLITLGTPYQGTGLARYGIGRNSRQMRRSASVTGACCSDWLQALNACSLQRVVPTVSIRSLHDNIIAPCSSATIDGATDIAFSGVGHVALGSDPAVMDCLLAQIRRIGCGGKRSA